MLEKKTPFLYQVYRSIAPIAVQDILTFKPAVMHTSAPPITLQGPLTQSVGSGLGGRVGGTPIKSTYNTKLRIILCWMRLYIAIVEGLFLPTCIIVILSFAVPHGDEDEQVYVPSSVNMYEGITRS